LKNRTASTICGLFCMLDFLYRPQLRASD